MAYLRKTQTSFRTQRTDACPRRSLQCIMKQFLTTIIMALRSDFAHAQAVLSSRCSQILENIFSCRLIYHKHLSKLSSIFHHSLIKEKYPGFFGAEGGKCIYLGNVPFGCGNNKDPSQPLQLHTLFKAFAVPMRNLLIFENKFIANSEYPDQSTR